MVRVTQGHPHTTSYSNLIETMRPSRTVLEILLLIFQKLKRSRESDHTPFKDIICRPQAGLAMINMHTIFEVSNLSRSIDILRGLKV